MSEPELKAILSHLQNLTSENEIVEFKEAKNNYDFNKLGKYFSALSNEANLKTKPFAWLVFGIEDKNHIIVGSQFRPKRKDLDSLKSEIANQTLNRITFIEIYELHEPAGRVILFQIPAAPKGLPISFKGHYYGRDNEELGPLNLEELERIRAQVIKSDWSAQVLEDATISDLDNKAIAFAREKFKSKFQNRATEVDEWDDITFLNKAKILIKGKITRTAIILLGKSESEFFLSPSECKIRWVLRNNLGDNLDYEIFSCPLILAVNKVFSKVRNLKYRYIKNESLFPEEVSQYEPFIIREAINNCIAHQDYTRSGRINMVEYEDYLVFSNKGEFIPNSVEEVVINNAPEETYRNPFLANAMFNVGMVDTAGGGIRKMFQFQAKKFFPLPEYEFNDQKVTLKITGKVIEILYARILAKNSNLSLNEIIMLDKVQKKKKISKEEATLLKKRKLIEGRKPNYHLSINLAKRTNQKAKYSKVKGFDKVYYLDLIKKAIREHDSLARKEIDELLWDKLPDWMDDNKKKNKVTNLISELRMKDQIENIGSGKKSNWVLLK